MMKILERASTALLLPSPSLLSHRLTAYFYLCFEIFSPFLILPFPPPPLRSSQYCFPNKWLYRTNLLDFWNDVYNMHRETKVVDVIHLHFQEAFHRVPHKRFLKKVESHISCTSGKISSRVKDWLSGRNNAS